MWSKIGISRKTNKVIRFTSVKYGILYLLNRFSLKTRKVGEQSGKISIGLQRSGSCRKVS